MKGFSATLFKYLLLSLLMLILQNASAEQDRGFIWEASAGNNRVYLMGSIHFADSSFYPLRNEIETAFAQSDTLVVEVDIATLDPVQMQAMVMQKGTYTDGSSIKDHISDNTYRLLEQYLQKRNLPVELFNRYKPGMLVMTLSSMELMQMGLSPAQGIDMHFLSHARGVKPIVELETLDQQLDLMMDVAENDQMLHQTLEEFDSYPELMAAMLDIWKRGDTEGLNELLIQKPLREYPQSKPVFEKMFIQRNLQMTEKITAYLNSGKSHFVVVGAGHLVGEGGIIDLLQRAGFDVRQL